MEWAEVMLQRDRLMHGLLPRLGEKQAWERANDIVQAVVVCEEEPPDQLVLRMLLRDLAQADAARLAEGLAGPWSPPTGERPPSKPPPGIRRPSQPAPPRRQRRETRIIGLWH